jgi:hypothetical protein
MLIRAHWNFLAFGFGALTDLEPEIKRVIGEVE